jgi:VWFA-related protein
MAAPAAEESVDVRLVHVDVLVMDKKGEPVRGLEQDAFKVKVDGKSVELAAFEGLESKTGEQGSDVLSWIVVIDDHFLRPASRARALDALESFFVEGGLGSGDGVVIARIQTQGKILLARTDDPDLISAAIDELRGMTPRLGGGSDPGRQIVEDLGRELKGFQGGGNPRSMSTPQIDLYTQSIRAYAMEERRYALTSLEAIANLMAMSADLPGRRALVHVSDGLPIRPGEELFSSVARTLEQAPQRGVALGESGETLGGGGSTQAQPDMSALAAEGRRFEITPELTQIAARANAARISLYGLHAGGGGEAGTGALGASVLGAGFQRALDNNLRGSLDFLAEETSARAAYGRKDIGGFLEIVRGDGRSRYVLAFEPPGEPDGAIHEISVKVKGHRSRDRVRHRKSFLSSARALSLEETLVRRLVAGPLGAPTGWNIEAGERSPHESGRHLVTLRALVPLSELLDAGTTTGGKVDVLVALLGAGGDVTIPGAAQIPVELPEGAAEGAREGALYPVDVSILVEPGQARAALALSLAEGAPREFLVTEIAP